MNQNCIFINTRQIIAFIRSLPTSIQQSIHLPTIVVCGDKSSGKTSIIQRIIGIDFLPRGIDNPTCVPIEITLINNTQNQQIHAKFYQQDEKFKNFQEVKKRIQKQSQNKFSLIKNFFDDPIKLKIFSKFSPDLKIIDLPGLTRISVRNLNTQNQNIQEITTNFIQKYCKRDKSNIIICVIPANIDISTSHALHLIQRSDPDGFRTLGVITKIDLMDKGTNAKNILNNNEIELRHGYIGVKNRSQQELKNGVEMSKCAKEQEQFFKKNIVYCEMNSQVFGIKNLYKKLNSIINGLFKRQIKQLIKKIKDNIYEIQQQLESLGEQFFYNKQDKFKYIWKIVWQVIFQFKNQIQGKYNPNKNLQNNYSAGILIKVLFRQLYSQYSYPNYQILKDISDQLIDRTIKMHQGQSIPGFPSIYGFMSLISPHLHKLRSPAIKCLQDVHNYVKILLGQLIKKKLKYQDSVDEIIDLIDDILEKKKENVEKIIVGNIDSQINFLFNNDPIYEQKYTKIIPDNKNKELKKNQQADIPNKIAFIKQMRLRVQAYFKMVVQILRELIPKNIGYLFVKNCQQTLQFQVYKKLLQKPQIIQSIGQPQQVILKRKQLKQDLKLMKKILKISINVEQNQKL